MLLSKESLSREKQKEYLGNIKISAESMLNLLNSLLEWNKLQSGGMNLHLRRFNAYETIIESTKIISGNALKKGVTIEIELDKKLSVYGDGRLFGQVINNLLSNAIKFSSTGKVVTVTSRPVTKERKIEFSIKDEGIGIEDKVIAGLFEMKKNKSRDGTAGEKGSGLGLILSKEIIKKHEGKIEVSSEPGKGSEFKFTFPISSNNILLVDDSKTDGLLYSKLLKTLVKGYNVVLLPNGKEALRALTNLSPALIISDHNMPVMDGLELVREIKSSDRDFKPSVIILSDSLSGEIRSEYRSMGIDYIFTKPVNLSIFKIALEKSLKTPGA
jgi:CheY-like chemotaxis protein